MSFFDMFKKQDTTPEMERAFEYLDQLSHTHTQASFNVVVVYIKKFIRSNSDDFTDLIKKGFDMHEWIYGAIGNTTADLLTKKRCYTLQGFLNDVGKEVHELYIAALDELLRIKAIDENRHRVQIDAIEKIIKSNEKPSPGLNR